MIGRITAETIVMTVGASIAANTEDVLLKYAIRIFFMSFIVGTRTPSSAMSAKHEKEFRILSDALRTRASAFP